MENIKEVVAQNIVNLRKQKKLTQVELAEQISYSDKAISRWEKGESLPDLETIYKLSLFFDVPVSFFFEENSFEKPIENASSNQKINKIMVCLLSILIVWLVAVIFYVYLKSYAMVTYWQIFVWAGTITCVVALYFNKIWGNRKYRIFIETALIWFAITSIYCHFISYNLWIIFLTGPLIEVIVIIKYFMKPIKKSFKVKNKKK